MASEARILKSAAAGPLALVAMLIAPWAVAADLAGFWQHEELPAWIEVRFDDGVGTGTVVRNEVYPERVGRVLLRNLTVDDEAHDRWRGQVYAERFEDFRDASISLPEQDRMQIKVKVGFMSRTVHWNRVAAIPGA